MRSYTRDLFSAPQNMIIRGLAAGIVRYANGSTTALSTHPTVSSTHPLSTLHTFPQGGSD